LGRSLGAIFHDVTRRYQGGEAGLRTSFWRVSTKDSVRKVGVWIEWMGDLQWIVRERTLL
jgi:hypothetical protein